MPIPSPDTLLPFVEQKRLTKDEFVTKLSAIMADADAVKLNYRGSGTYAFYVEGRTTQIDGELVAKALRDAGYVVHRYMGQVGYMPPPYYHDFASAAHDTPDVKGYPQFEWTLVMISKA